LVASNFLMANRKPTQYLKRRWFDAV
jgi:hypothetical protein